MKNIILAVILLSIPTMSFAILADCNTQGECFPIDEPVNEDVQTSWWSIIKTFLLIAFGFVVLFLSSIITPQKTSRVIERLGKFNRLATAGFSFKIPFVEYIAGEINLRIRELSEEIEAKSKDNAFVKIPVKVQFQVLEVKAKESFYELSEPEQQISSYIVNVVRSTATTMTMEDIFQNKNVFEKDVETELNERFNSFGYQIVNVLVDNPLPSEEVMRSFNKVIASLREREAAQNEADAEKIRRIGKAQAESQSKKLQGEGMAAMRKAIAEGAKEATASLKEAMPELNDKEIAEFLLGITRLDAMTTVGEQGNLILMDTDKNVSDGFAGTLAALKTKNNSIKP